MATDHSNEVVAAVDGDAIELTVQSAKFAQPRMYAYALTDTLQAFCQELAGDLARFFDGLY